MKSEPSILPPAPVPLEAAPPFRSGLVASFGHALDGLVDAVDRGRSMKIQLVSGLLVALVGAALPLPLFEQLALMACVGAVISAEAFNTAIEAAVDLSADGYQPLARVAKDAAAAAVLVLSAISAVVFLAIVVAEWGTVVQESARVWRQLAVGVPLAACASGLLARGGRTLAVDLALAVAGALLLAATARWTTSAAFTALAALTFAGCALVVVRRWLKP